MILTAESKAPRVLALQARSGAMSQEDRAAIIVAGLSIEIANQLTEFLPIEERDDPAGEPGDTIVSLQVHVFTKEEVQELWQALSAPGACEPKTLAKAKEILFAL